MRKDSNTLHIVALIAVALIALLTWCAFQPPPGRPRVSATFLGHTNDASGAPLARFAISNLSYTAVYRQPYYFIEMPAPSHPAGLTGYQARTRLPGRTVLQAGAHEIVTIPVPTNSESWRFYVRIYPDTKPVRAVKVTASEMFRAIGMNPRYRVMWYGFHSDWVAKEK
jgi:hypothetical protein